MTSTPERAGTGADLPRGIRKTRTAARRVPCASLLFVLAAAAAVSIPGADRALEYDRAAIASGEVWRWLTCHVSHFGWNHFAWDTIVFAFLGVLCERDGRTRFLACLSASAIAIPAAVWALHPEMATYRGLSGLDSAVFALFTAAIVREKIARGEFLWVTAAAGIFLAFLGKVAYEAITGATFFVDSAASGMIPLPLVHLAGAAAGLAAGFWPAGRRGEAAGNRPGIAAKAESLM